MPDIEEARQDADRPQSDKLGDHDYVLRELMTAQEVDHYNRVKVRESKEFVNERGGQWEQHTGNTFDDKPRYTLDMVTPIVDAVTGVMEKMDFVATVQPAGGDSTKDIAETYEGILRNIQNISNASNIYNSSGKEMVISGMDGWEVVQEFVDGDTFHQDLIIKNIYNWVDRVWFGYSEEQDRSDSMVAWKLNGFTKEQYKDKYPKGSGVSVTNDSDFHNHFNTAELIMVGVFYFIKETDRELVLMDNGKTYDVEEGYKKVKDELETLGIREVNRRTRKKRTVWTRQFDANDWLSDAKETVFQSIPLIPTFGNYSVFKNKIVYWGAVEKLIDPQRVLNFLFSRQLQEAALNPTGKIVATEKQIAGFEDSYATLNTNMEPLLLYNPDPDAPAPPTYVPGGQINQGLAILTEQAKNSIGEVANQFAASQGNNPGLQSGVAIKQLQFKGDTTNIKYITSQEVAICQTLQVLIPAIPIVYPPGRQVRLLKEDNTFEMVTLGERVFDKETKTDVVLNDLSQGTYDVTCSAGPMYKSQMEEAVAAITEMSQFDPSIMAIGNDVVLKNVTAPGTDIIAERLRQQKLLAGQIPESQMTDEDKQIIQQHQQQSEGQTSLEQTIAQTGLLEAQQGVMNEQNRSQELELKRQSKGADLQGEREERDIKIVKTQSDIDDTRFNQVIELMEQDREDEKLELQQLTAQVKNLVELQTAAAGIIQGPGLLDNVKTQSDLVSKEQTQQ